MSIPLRSRAANRSREAARFIVDNSVWARLSTSQQVRAAFVDLVNLHSPASIMVCPPVVAKAGFSARAGADHTRVTHELTAFPDCRRHPAAPTSSSCRIACGMAASCGASAQSRRSSPRRRSATMRRPFTTNATSSTSPRSPLASDLPGWCLAEPSSEPSNRQVSSWVDASYRSSPQLPQLHHRTQGNPIHVKI